MEQKNYDISNNGKSEEVYGEFLVIVKVNGSNHSEIEAKFGAVAKNLKQVESVLDVCPSTPESDIDK